MITDSIVQKHDQLKPVGADIVVWFSCGAASAVAAKKTIEIYGKDNRVRVINNPIKEEHEDNRRFLADVEKWLETPIESLINPKYPDFSAVAVWEKRKAMSFPDGAPCTTELKRQARFKWEKNNDADYHVMGFTNEEQNRHDNWSEPVPLLPVLIELNLSKQDCFDELARNNIKLPEIYLMGFPNANCLGCPKATSPEYWNLLRIKFPKIFEERAEISYRLGVRLVRVKGERIFLDELHPQQKGQKMKTVKPFQCSLFC